jgi:hypothetical protein
MGLQLLMKVIAVGLGIDNLSHHHHHIRGGGDDAVLLVGVISEWLLNGPYAKADPFY